MTAPVAIAGAGPVGLSLAVGLTHHGVRSVVLVGWMAERPTMEELVDGVARAVGAR